MQKKIIALAVAGLVSGTAFAQSNVTVWGILDMGYQYSWDNVADGVKNKSDIKAGGLDGSRIGFKGTEDLGNGLKAIFDATLNFDADTGVNGGTLMGEGSSVGLVGNFGTVRAGYFGNFLDDNTGVDASGRHGMIHSGSLYDTGKYKNFVAYISPSFSGLTVKAGVSTNASVQDNSPAVNRSIIANTRAYTAAVSYENGPIQAGVAYAMYKGQEGDLYIGDNEKSSDWNAGISYNFGVARVSLFGAQQKLGDGATASTIPNNVYLAPGVYDKNTFWALGVSAPVGANGIVKAGYGRSKLSGVSGHDDDKANAWDVVYFHSLSKRTTIYAMYGNLNVDEVDNSTARTTYQQAFNVGLKHTF